MKKESLWFLQLMALLFLTGVALGLFFSGEASAGEEQYREYIKQYMQRSPEIFFKINIIQADAINITDSDNCLVVPVFGGEFPLKSVALSEVDKTVLEALADQEIVTGAVRTHYYLPTPSGKHKGVLVLGLGNRADFEAESLRGCAGSAVAAFRQHRVRHLYLDVVHFPELPIDAFIEALVLGQYTYSAYKKAAPGASPAKISEITVIVRDDSDIEGLRQACDKAMLVALATNGARHLADTAANDKTPDALARTAQEIASASKSPLTCVILEEEQMGELGMGALLGVARGSEAPPKLILLEYRHPAAARTIALTGKGVTFDSGGISIKSGSRMHEMKYDMCGAAAVLSTMMALDHLRPAINVIGVVPAVVNMPDGRAQTPGDIVRAYNGKTIEVWNTDAEGRMILADSMAYAIDRYKPDCIVDIATLTGAVTVALGKMAAAVLGTDDALADGLLAAGEKTGERLWRLPLWKEYDTLIEGKVADLINIGSDGQAGTIVGAAFLKQFVGDTPWAHLDIAGTAYGVSNRSYLDSNYATGFGVRLFTQWLLTQTAE